MAYLPESVNKQLLHDGLSCVMCHGRRGKSGSSASLAIAFPASRTAPCRQKVLEREHQSPAHQLSASKYLADMASATLHAGHHELPIELVLSVIDHLSDDKKALCMLARTNRALQHFAEEHIYKTIPLEKVLHLHAIIQAFTYRHERVRAVQTLKLQYHYNTRQLEDSIEMRKTFNECVAHMVNLREWHIESPYDNCQWEDEIGPEKWVKTDMEKFRVALQSACIDGPREAHRIHAEQALGKVVERTVGLALLEKLTIHSHGASTDFWDLGGFECVFDHPTLRYLHVSCVSLTEELPALRSITRKTPLSTLVLDECDISPACLRDILCTPAKLKHLTLGENVWNTSRSKTLRPRLTKDPTASLEALSAVAHSLESLVHFDPTWKLSMDDSKVTRISPIGDGMREFHALRYIECEMASFLHTAIIMNRDISPPNLETLRLRRHWYMADDFFEKLPEVQTYASLPSLSTLEFMQALHCWHAKSKADYVCDEPWVRARHAYAYKLFKAGKNIKVLIEMHKSADIIPPYLHGEAPPIVECLYDAQDVGFQRHIINELMVSFKGRSEGTGEEEKRFPWEGYERGATSEDPEETFQSRMQHQLYVNDHPNAVAKRGLKPPDTDQLGDVDIRTMQEEVEDTIERLRHRFVRNRRLRRAASFMDSDDDGEEDEDGELDIEMDEDWSDEDYEDAEMGDDGDGWIFHEDENGELYVEVSDSDTDGEEVPQVGAVFENQ